MKLHHIGIATDDIDKMIAKLTPIFRIASISNTVFDENQNARLCMLTMEDGSRMELVSGAAVEKRVKKRQHLYHTCYETEDLDGTISRMVDDGAFLVSEPKEAVLFGMRKVAFLMTEMGLVELLEQPKEI